MNVEHVMELTIPVAKVVFMGPIFIMVVVTPIVLNLV
jgi:hypothetical protein